ncbi:fimbrial protein [Salmonella enterica subsp. enterica serovar Javiana]|nr:fimbrial protein [Salmonella enterica subsp. enterica serovar Javiana]
MLITAWAVACPPAAAQDTEKMQHLGVVNGQVKDNQVVEVTRTLTDPVLYKVDAPEVLPQTLRIRNATVRAADNRAMNVTVEQMLSGRAATVTAKVALWVDGQRVAATYNQQGVDVLVSLPSQMKAQKQVMLRSDNMVTLQVPANWRGPVAVTMDIVGEA